MAGGGSGGGDGDEIATEIPLLLRIYKDGRVERMSPTVFVPASVDPSTGVESRDVVIDPATGVSARLYLPPPPPPINPSGDELRRLPLLIYFHGGGFCIESAFSPLYHTYLNSLVSRSGALAVSVEYRLAPEHPIPAAYDDAWAAVAWALSDDWIAGRADLGRVFVAGDSAGGNIAFNVAMRAAPGTFRGAALVHPYFWGTVRMPSEIGGSPRHKAEEVDLVWPVVCGGESGNDDPRLNPIVDGAPGLERMGCGKVVVFVAERDVVRDRGVAFCERLRTTAGAPAAELVVTEGKDHCFHLLEEWCDEADAFMESMVRFINSGH